MSPYTNKSNAARAARRELGPEAIPGADFTIVADKGMYRWEPVGKAPPPLTPVAKVARPAVERVDISRLPPPVKNRKPSKIELARAAAEAGQLPEPPVFVSATAKTYQRRLDPIIAAAKAGDVATLKAQPVDAASKDGRVAVMGRYRDLCLVALAAKVKADA